MYPPGTVAEVPIGNRGLRLPTRLVQPKGFGAWRLNKFHVYQIRNGFNQFGAIIENGLDWLTGLECTTIPSMTPTPLWPLQGVAVFLDDPSCVAKRSCAPRVPDGVQFNSSAYINATVAWARAQMKLPPSERSMHIGCSPYYSVNSTEWNVDLVHYDYPAAA